jgi:ribosomal protein S18 acetylase RimI-like enzyme
MGAIIVRTARPQDCEAVAAMVRDLASLARVVSGTTAEILRREAFGSRPTIAILVAEEEARLIGCLVHQDTFSTWRGANGVFVVDFYVRPQQRGRGIGLALIKEAARLGHHKGARFMRLDVERDNEAALRLYDRLGFRTADHLFKVMDEPAMLSLAGLAPSPAASPPRLP